MTDDDYDEDEKEERGCFNFMSYAIIAEKKNWQS